MNLSSLVSSNLLPAGAVMSFANNSVPAGWLAANGAELLKTSYSALFAAIGITYGETNGSGGAGTTHFRVPDLRGYFVRGAGTNSDATGSGTFGAKQTDAVIAHTHSGTTDNDSPDHSHQFGTWGGSAAGAGNGPLGYFAGPYGPILGPSTVGASTRHTHTFTTSGQSPAGATETRPKNIALLYCIKF